MEEFKKLLHEYVSFKSISTDKAFVKDISNTVAWLASTLSHGGFKTEVWKGQPTNPVFFASYELGKKAETILVYGHYDVQPAQKDEGWFGDPFSLVEKNGRLYARGVVDNKGQNLIHIYTVLDLIKQNKLKYNVKFLIEGNEETSNPEIALLIKQKKSKLNCDYVLISDGELLAGKPTIEYSLRGGFNLTLRFKTASNNLHSGIYGGAIPNAAFELSKFLSDLFDKEHKVAVPGFYTAVDPISKDQIKNNKKLTSRDEVLALTGAKEFVTEKGLDFYTQTGLRPTLQITGLKSGYISDGYANIVPNTAEVRINFRTVTSQNENKLLKLFEKYVEKNVPKYVEYSVTHSEPYGAIRVNTSSQKVQEVKLLLKKAFVSEVFDKPVGGGIPVVLDFKKILGKDTILVSLGNDDCNMHGVNENFDLEVLEKGLRFSQYFFSK